MVYSVSETDRRSAEHLILNVHYAKRWPSISKYFALYKDGDIVGVVTYGSPCSAPLRRGVAGEGMAHHVIELNRLVLYHNLPNEASMLVGRSLKRLGNSIVVSYADTAQGHIGKVYQACNFIYCGLSAKRTDWKLRGKEHLHGQSVADEFRGMPDRVNLMREKYGGDFYLQPRSRKHRYVYLAGDKRFKRAALAALRYKQERYP